MEQRWLGLKPYILIEVDFKDDGEFTYLYKAGGGMEDANSEQVRAFLAEVGELLP